MKVHEFCDIVDSLTNKSINFREFFNKIDDATLIRSVVQTKTFNQLVDSQAITLEDLRWYWSVLSPEDFEAFSRDSNFLLKLLEMHVVSFNEIVQAYRASCKLTYLIEYDSRTVELIDKFDQRSWNIASLFDSLRMSTELVAFCRSQLLFQLVLREDSANLQKLIEKLKSASDLVPLLWRKSILDDLATTQKNVQNSVQLILQSVTRLTEMLCVCRSAPKSFLKYALDNFLFFEIFDMQLDKTLEDGLTTDAASKALKHYNKHNVELADLIVLNCFVQRLNFELTQEEKCLLKQLVRTDDCARDRLRLMSETLVDSAFQDFESLFWHLSKPSKLMTFNI